MNILIHKRAEKNKNRIIIPKAYIKEYGRDFYMTIKDNGEIILKPINRKKGK